MILLAHTPCMKISQASYFEILGKQGFSGLMIWSGDHRWPLTSIIYSRILSLVITHLQVWSFVKILCWKSFYNLTPSDRIWPDLHQNQKLSFSCHDASIYWVWNIFKLSTLWYCVNNFFFVEFDPDGPMWWPITSTKNNSDLL